MAVDLTLPLTIPHGCCQAQDDPEPQLPFALYCHVNLNDEDLEELLKTCNGSLDGTVQAIREYDLRGQPLRAALDSHIEHVVPTHKYDPTSFIAVVYENWKHNVLIVTLDDGRGEDECYIDTMRVPAHMAGSILVNVHLANVDWQEYKNEYAGKWSTASYDCYMREAEHRAQGDWNGNITSAALPSLGKEQQADAEYSDGSSAKPPHVEYWMGFYSIPGIDDERVMRELCPSWGPPIPSSELVTRPQGRVSSEEAVSEAARLHPMRCKRNSDLHRTLFLIIDSVNYTEEGVILAKLDWDGHVGDGRSMKDLADIGESVARDTQRLQFENCTTITIFNEIHAGYRPWKHTHKTFFAYAGPDIRYAGEYLKPVDRSFRRRHSGGERFIENDDGEPLEAVVNRHWDFVWNERFRDTLCPNYFVYCDKKLDSSDTDKLVTIVRIDRSQRWSYMQCPAGDVYDILCALVDETKTWHGDHGGTTT
jgi:hypothetical protein